MLPTEDLFVYVYVLIDDLITARIIAIPPRRARLLAAATPNYWPSRRMVLRVPPRHQDRPEQPHRPRLGHRPRRHQRARRGR
jgi:hypothetical protein